MRHSARDFRVGLLLAAAAAAAPLLAVDKNGVSPQAISLPSGPGSIQGLGESFQPQLNTGGASYAIPFSLPGGTAGHTPSLGLSYDAGAANGCLGLGWALDGLVSVTRNTDAGVPRYVDAQNGLDDDADGVIDNPQEIDVFSGMDREELVPLADGSFRAESETAFTRYERSGAGWLARRRDGTRFELGMSAASRIEDSGRIFSWLIDRVSDTDGNTIAFEYATDASSPGQRYLTRIRWGQPAAFFVAVLTYAAGRPDVVSDLRAGFEVRTALRLVRVDVVSQGIPARADALRGDLDGNGVADALIRRWTLAYHDDVPVSLLSRVTQLGVDGVTALPPVSLEYTRWTPPADVAAHVIQCLGEPAETLSSGSVELCDMNGDGLPDLLSTSASQHRVAANLGMTADGRLEWAPAVPVGNAPSVDIASPTAHLADATADGLSDLVVKVSNTRFLCFDNTSQSSWTAAAAPLRNTDTWPVWPFEGANGAASRSMDTDYNRRNDILFTSSSGYQLWLLLPQGQYARETRLPPLLCEGQAFRFDLPGTHIADLNGDRLQDLVWVQATRVVWFPNLGRDRFGSCQILPLGRTLVAADIEKTGFSDIDGDGLEDLTVVRPASAARSVTYWLNRFQDGLEGPRSLDGLPAALAGDALRWADMNGNGSSDIVISNSARPAGSRLLVIELLPEGKPHVLSRAANGLGVVMQLQHETSVDQMVRARRAGAPWSSVMQISVPVVRRITEDDSRGNVSAREITYRDPFWNPAKQEFRGFRDVQLREVGDASAPDRLTRHRFDAGVEADCMKGKQLLDEVLDETGKVFSRNETAWTRRVLAVGNDAREVCFAFAESTDTLHIEGIEAAVATRVERDYDAFGNQTIDRNEGIVGAPGDEVEVVSEYEVREDVWIIDRLSRKITLDGAGRHVAEERFAYDPRGRLIRHEAWLDAEDRFIVKVRNAYDDFGNVIEVLDPLGHRRTIEIDPVIHAYPTAESYHLDDRTLRMTAEYDLGFGVIVSGVEFSGVAHAYGYDALGRITRFDHPGGARKEIEYHLSSPVSHIVERSLEAAGGGTFDTFTFYDGHGRKLGAKLEAEGGRWRYLNAVRFNARKLVSEEWLPYETSGPVFEEPLEAMPHEQRSYDAMARPVRTVHPDGASVTNVYEPLVVHFFDEDDTGAHVSPRSTRRDGLGRIVEVVERSAGAALSTTYRWSAQGDLLEIRDAQGNRKTMAYDSLRRRTSMSDPDRGSVAFTHDDESNLIRTQDARGQTTESTFDFAHRLVSETLTGAGAAAPDVIEYVYDDPSTDIDLGDGSRGTAAFTTGRLASVIDPSGETHFSYDERGNTAWVVKRIREPQSGLLVSYRTQLAHDAMDRLTEVIYPDNDRVRYVYNDGNFVERIDGGPQGQVFIADLDHHPGGEVSRIEHGNGVVGQLTYDDRHRLRTLLTTGPSGVELLHHEYAFDAASNLTALVDRRPFSTVERSSPRRNTQIFAHDDLHRLTQVRYAQPDDLAANLGQIDLAYDAIGNILSRTTPVAGQTGHLGGNVHLGAVSYGGGRSGRAGRRPADPPGPHAVTGTATGHALTYDANGNVAGVDGATLSWDVKDQLVGYQRPGLAAKYLYDYAERRVAKSVTADGHTDETLYVDQYYEERPGRTPVKHVFSGVVRVARVEGTIDPSRDRLQRLRLTAGWNSLALAVESSRTLAQIFGADATVYAGSNGSHALRAPTSPATVGEPLWVHVPSARAVAVQGRYRPATAPVSLPSGASLVAWPRLDRLVLAASLRAAARIHLYSPAAGRFLLRDPSLPSFLQQLGGTLPAASAFWIDAPPGTTLAPGAQAAAAVAFYHADHLGSASVTTDAEGALVEELAYYPFGEVRHRHTVGGPAPLDYDFTGKETDDESGLVYHGARHYHPVLGRFLSIDPLNGDPAGLEGEKLEPLLTSPQKLNLYSYVLNNPMVHSDPDGLEERSKRGMTRMTAEEHAAVVGPPTSGFRPRATVSIANPRTGYEFSYHSSDDVALKPISRDNYRAGWRQVQLQFKVTGPDGKAVTDRYFEVHVSGKPGTGHGLYTARTDMRGNVKVDAYVPEHGGKLWVTATYDQDGELGMPNWGKIDSFKRSEGQDKLKFDVKLRDLPMDVPAGHVTEAKVTQIR